MMTNTVYGITMAIPMAVEIEMALSLEEQDVCKQLGEALKYHRLGNYFLAGFRLASAAYIVSHVESDEATVLVDAVGDAFAELGLFNEPAPRRRKSPRRRGLVIEASPEARQAVMAAIRSSNIKDPALEEIVKEWGNVENISVK